MAPHPLRLGSGAMLLFLVGTGGGAHAAPPLSPPGGEDTGPSNVVCKPTPVWVANPVMGRNPHGLVKQLGPISSNSVPSPDCPGNPVLGQRSTPLPPPPIPAVDVEAARSDYDIGTNNFYPDPPDNATTAPTPPFYPTLQRPSCPIYGNNGNTINTPINIKAVALSIFRATGPYNPSYNKPYNLSCPCLSLSLSLLVFSLLLVYICGKRSQRRLRLRTQLMHALRAHRPRPGDWPGAAPPVSPHLVRALTGLIRRSPPHSVAGAHATHVRVTHIRPVIRYNTYIVQENKWATDDGPACADIKQHVRPARTNPNTTSTHPATYPPNNYNYNRRIPLSLFPSRVFRLSVLLCHFLLALLSG